MGHMNGASNIDGSIVVDGNLWMLRLKDQVTSSADSQKNLFGYHSKSERHLAQKPATLTPFDFDEFYAKYVPDMASFYKRGVGFSTPGNRNLKPLSAESIISIHRTSDQSDTPYSFVLPDFTLSAQLRIFCGHGADEARFWRKVDLGPVAIDTLIVNPDINSATMIWRASWLWDGYPTEDYRKIQIFQTGA